MTTQRALANPLQAVSDVLAAIAEKVGNSVVAVQAGRRFPSSGFVWTAGTVVTTAHAIAREDNIRLQLSGEGMVTARLIGRDAASDIAVLAVPDLAISPSERADANSLKPGNIVLALARLGEGHVSLDHGLVATVGPAWRTWQGAELDRLVVLDGGLRPGYSGGPLVDARGLVLGMCTSALLRGSGALIPESTVHRVVEELRVKGRVSRGYFGVGLQAVELPAPAVALLKRDSSRALLVTMVEKDGPAERAGVIVGDVLVGLAGKECHVTEDVLTVLGSSQAGQTVPIVLMRGERRLEFNIALGERPQRTAC